MIELKIQMIKTIQNLLSSRYIQAFLLLVLMDILTGIFKAIYNKRLNSKIGLNGLIRHTLIIAIVLSIAIFLPLFEYKVMARSIIVFYCFQYSISIIENIISMGVPVPDFLKTSINILYDKSNRGDIFNVNQRTKDPQ